MTTRKRSDLETLMKAIEMDAANNTRIPRKRTKKARFDLDVSDEPLKKPGKPKVRFEPQSNAKNAWKRLLAHHTAPVRVAVRKTAERKQRLMTQKPSTQNMLPVTYVTPLTSLGYKLIQFLLKGTSESGNGISVMDVNSLATLVNHVSKPMPTIRKTWQMSGVHHKITATSPLGYTLAVGIGPDYFLLYAVVTSKNDDSLIFLYNVKKHRSSAHGKKTNLMLLTYMTQVFPRQFAPFVNGPLLRYMSTYVS